MGKGNISKKGRESNLGKKGVEIERKCHFLDGE